MYAACQLNTGFCVKSGNYRPRKKLREGNVFTPICHSVHGRGVRGQVSASGSRGCLPLGPGGVCLWVQAVCHWVQGRVSTTPPEHTPLGTHTPLIPSNTHTLDTPLPPQTPPDMPSSPVETAIEVGCTHPTGIHSCYHQQTKFAAGNVFTCVCHSVHGGCMSGRGHAWQEGACMTRGVHGRGEHAWQMRHVWWGWGHVWWMRAWQERRPLQCSVRILLECILVLTTCDSLLNNVFKMKVFLMYSYGTSCP